MALTAPNVETSNNVDVATGGEFGFKANGGPVNKVNVTVNETGVNVDTGLLPDSAFTLNGHAIGGGAPTGSFAMGGALSPFAGGTIANVMETYASNGAAQGFVGSAIGVNMMQAANVYAAADGMHYKFNGPASAIAQIGGNAIQFLFATAGVAGAALTPTASCVMYNNGDFASGGTITGGDAQINNDLWVKDMITIGVGTKSNWPADIGFLEFSDSAQGFVGSNAYTGLCFGSNAYFDAVTTTWKYKAAGPSFAYYQDSTDGHTFVSAPIGVADADITFTTDASINPTGIFNVKTFTSGNMGIPNAVSTKWSGLDILEFNHAGDEQGFITSGGGMGVTYGSNAYWDGSDWRYSGNGYAVGYSQLGGAQIWVNAPIGVADAVISWVYDMYIDTNGALDLSSTATLLSSTAVPAGGTTGAGLMFSSVANLGVFFGSGAPTLTAAQGSLYMNTAGSGVTDRMYINTDGGTTWTNVVTAA